MPFPTARSRLPRLSREAIRHWVGPEAMRRGLAYYRAGRLSALCRYGATLLALCQGQAVKPYRVRVTLDAQGIQQARCTYLAGRDGWCKHVAALLWAWHHRPQALRAPQPLAPRLRRLSPQALMELIGLLLEHAPHLHEVVEGYLARQAPAFSRSSSRHNPEAS